MRPYYRTFFVELAPGLADLLEVMGDSQDGPAGVADCARPSQRPKRTRQVKRNTLKDDSSDESEDELGARDNGDDDENSTPNTTAAPHSEVDNVGIKESTRRNAVIVDKPTAKETRSELSRNRTGTGGRKVFTESEEDDDSDFDSDAADSDFEENAVVA
jgi:hypothetical protein